MPEYSLTVLGLELSFTADAGPERIHNAVELLQSRFDALHRQTGQMSKERLLIYLALSLADDYLQDQGKLRKLDVTLQQLLSKIDSPDSPFPLGG